MAKEKPGYWAVLPARVRYDKDLPCGTKLFYAEITALSNKKGYCWANNAHFADLYDCSKRTISRWISQLAGRGYIDVEMVDGDGARRRIRPLVAPTDDAETPARVEADDEGVDKNVEGGSPEMAWGVDENDVGVRQNCPPHTNNKDNTKTNNKTSTQKIGANSRSHPPSDEEAPNLQQEAEVDDKVSATPARGGKNNKKSAGPPAANGDFRFGPDDWQTQAASAFWDALTRFDVLAKSHRTKDRDEVREEIDEWAYVFDKLHRLKEFSLDDLRLIYHWLFQNENGEPQNWWIQQGNIQSARKLYQKNKEGIRYADYFLQKAKAHLRNDPTIKKERARREEEQRYQDFIDSL